MPQRLITLNSFFYAPALPRCLLLLMLCLPMLTGAQTTTPRDTTKKQPVNVDHADLFQYIQQNKKIIQKLNGNVAMSQDSVYMSCDSATIEDNIRVVAQGEVLIQHGDSVSVFSDSLRYDGSSRIAELFGEVILVNGQQKLFTDHLIYDLNTRTATYNTKAVLTLGETQLTSNRGYYYVNTKEVYFKDSVVVVDPRFSLRSDTLKFNTENKTVYFLGPTLVTSDSSRIYCEGGFYDTENNLALFTDNAQYVKGEQKARADSIRYEGRQSIYTLEGNARFVEAEKRTAQADIIRYDANKDTYLLKGAAFFQDSLRTISAEEINYDVKKKRYATKGRSRVSDPPQLLDADELDYSSDDGLGIAKGNVIWQDTSAQLTVACELAEYNRETGYLKALGGRNNRPLLITLIDGDSLFMTADTLVSSKTDTLASDSTRLIQAYRDVRIFKSNLQALCDSLAYSTVDSIFRLFHNPIVWSDTTQFTADTIHMQLANKQLDAIFLRDNSFIINSPDELFYNQIKGKDITARFDSSELRTMLVVGNAESVYYARDEQGAYIGVNKTACSEMILYFGNNQVNQIKFYTQPQGSFKPMREADHEALKIKGFRWVTAGRPLNLDMLFEPKTPLQGQQ
jgi:lipopolysaccharide transport protein LptA